MSWPAGSAFEESCDVLREFYRAWATGNSETFIDQLHPTNVYNESGIKNSDRPGTFGIDNLSMKMIQEDPEEKRIRFFFSKTDNPLEEDEIESIGKSDRKTVIISVDPDLLHKQDSVQNNATNKIRNEISQRRRHLLYEHDGKMKIIA